MKSHTQIISQFSSKHQFGFLHFNSVFEVMKKITSTSVIKAIGVEGRDNGSGQWSGILRAEMNAVDATQYLANSCFFLNRMMGELSLIAPPILFRNKPAGKSSKINGFGRLRRRCLGEGRRRLSCEYDKFRGCEGPEILRAFGYFYLNTSRYFYFGKKNFFLTLYEMR